MTPGDRASQRAEPEPAPASRASAGAAPPVDVTAVRDAFSLDWDVAHLNHGSFGAVPRSVQDAVARTRAAAERDYDAFFADRLFDELAASRTALAAWLGWSPEGTVFAANATTALQTAVAHLALQPGDEVVTTSHEYDATNRVLELLAGRGVTIQIVPVSGLDAPTIVARVLAAVGTRTRAVLLSHVTSPWAEVLPVELAAAALAGTRTTLLVDGAHGPGLVDTSAVTRHGAWYAATLHKWGYFPRGTGALHVPADARDTVRPLVTSWHVGAGTAAERFSWLGTSDVAPLLVTDDVRAVHRDLEGAGAVQRAALLTDWLRHELQELPGAEPVPGNAATPLMAAVRLPASDGAALRRALAARGIQLWAGQTAEGTVVRASLAPYVSDGDVDRALGALRDLV